VISVEKNMKKGNRKERVVKKKETWKEKGK
jgi:hypothetical protein